MYKQDELVFSLYKPFRNQIRSYNLIESLYVIWGYARNFTFNHPFPQDIERPNGFSPYGDISERRYRGITEHEQELLLREFIINCDTKPTKNSLKQRHRLAKLINYLRFKFNEDIHKHNSAKGDILIELNRIMHRQFKWQIGYSKKILFRYYKVFNDDEVNSIVKSKLKLSSYDMFLLGTFFFGHTAKHFQIKLPLASEAPFLNNEMIDIFFQNFSISIEEARQELKDCQQMNENYFYSYNPLLAKPILRYNDVILCPIPILLFWLMTSGLYYSIVGEPGFENAYGNSFQKYIGEVLSKCCNNKNLTVFAEEKYNKDEKRTSDWIIVDDNAVLFIECKAKRMTQLSKSELDIKKGLENDLKKMATFIKQLYKTYFDYTENKYPQLKYNGNKKFIPLVVTLESWYINLNPKILELLRDFVIQNLKESNIDETIIDKFPYYIRSAEEFENDIQLINSLGIIDYFDRVDKNKLHEVLSDFKFKDPFQDDFEKTFMDPIKIK